MIALRFVARSKKEKEGKRLERTAAADQCSLVLPEGFLICGCSIWPAALYVCSSRLKCQVCLSVFRWSFKSVSPLTRLCRFFAFLTCANARAVPSFFSLLLSPLLPLLSAFAFYSCNLATSPPLSLSNSNLQQSTSLSSGSSRAVICVCAVFLFELLSPPAYTRYTLPLELE